MERSAELTKKLRQIALENDSRDFGGGADIFDNNNRKLENSPKTRSERGVWTEAEFDTMEDTDDP